MELGRLRPRRERHHDQHAAHHGRGGRSAGVAVRPLLLPSRPDQKHLWHGLLYAHEHRRRGRRIQERSGLHDRYRRGRQDQLCARGFYLCRRLNHELAAQQHGHHLECERVRATRRFDQRQRGLLLRPRLRWPGRSLVGPACPRYRVRPYRCLESRDHCACGLRVHGLPEL